MSETISGFISNYIYEASDSMYKVATLTTDSGDITITGNFPRLEDGLNYEFRGQTKLHLKYGMQFIVESYSKIKQTSLLGLEYYLSSDSFKGVGPKLAKAIIDKLGVDTIDKILENKDVLDGIKGMNNTKKEMIYNTIKDNHNKEKVYIRLYEYGLTNKMVLKLIDNYGLSAADIIEENPYALIGDIENFAFKRADSLAMKIGFNELDIRRIKAASLYSLSYVCYNKGFTFLTNDQLLQTTFNLLNNNPKITVDLYDDAIKALEAERKIVIEDNKIFDYRLYNAEIKVRDYLLELDKTKVTNYNKEKIKESLASVEKTLGISYTDLQKEAIIKSLENKLSIITGGPGTGKSTILYGIINTFALLNSASIVDDLMQIKILLVAPTGRAAKRMNMAAKFKATTIHKALGYNNEYGFTYNENNKLNCSIAIIDEASMVDIELFKAFLAALPKTSRLILIGDSNQLPSVGPGDILADLMLTKIFNTTALKVVMRQSSDSNIIMLSHMILNERISYNIFSSKKEVFFYPYQSKDMINGIFRILDNYISKGGDLFSGIQILIPMYGGVCGIDNVNKEIQNRYNLENEKIYVRGDTLFKKGDKVLQIKNDSELDIMNGDIGKIVDVTKIDDKEVLLIDFDGRILTYNSSQIENITLGYAISIHKSQGSEFDNVILPICESYKMMLKKKIIYTAVTRAKKKLIMLGSLDSLDYAIHVPDYKRQTMLYNRIENNDPKSKLQKILDPLIPFEYFGEYDMEDITPYSFMK